ncbi:MAG: DUF559 domain-containing protein [Acinetobacter sp.]|uniref:DUF559 domain-containing protein n=1 Tax=Acinetobacter sp. TaxID=472 RepID=UPI0026DFD79B|nr:DUF559 domain-containing protein [Acinetobacter sp.]MDO5541740.1 DUF559 domain-containing protein [Acinetobacter sp.]
MRMSIAEYNRLIKPKQKPNAQSTARPKQKIVSKGEAALIQQLRALKIEFVQEFKFHSTRKWRADFYIKNTKLLIEIEGGIWSGGRHTRGKGYIGDMEKYNAATMMGFQVLRFSTEQVTSGFAIKQIEGLVKG